MKAMYLDKQAGPAALVLGDLPVPQPAAGQVLVRVHATAVTPTEFEWYPTFHTLQGDTRSFPIVPGHELSGVIEAAGDGAANFKPGDAVYGINDWFANGALAEYNVAPASSIAPKPTSLTHAQAAVVPISALTAWQALFTRGDLQPGQRVLIHGAAGGVGVFAIQLARWRGAHVIATASSGNLDFVRSLGADEVIDYKAIPFETVAQDIDLVIDTVGGDTLNRSWGVLRAGGRVVTIAAGSSGSQDPRVREAFMLVEGRSDQLAELAKLFDSGTLTVPVEAEYALSEAREAYARAAKGRMRGKIAVRIE